MTKIEVKSKLFDLTLNSVMKMLAGKMFSSRKNKSGSNEEEVFRKWVEEVVFLLGGRANFPDFFPFLRWMNFGIKKKVAYLSKYRDEYFQTIIDDIKHSTNEEQNKTMFATLLSLQKTDPTYYTDEFIKGFAITMIVAGIDTTSNTVEWALTLLLNNPEKLKKLQTEIDEKVGDNRLVQESDVQNLPYLQSVITESLRVKPSGPMMVPHEASEDCTVGGYNVTKGTILLVNAQRILSDPDTWVEPMKFEPERYLDGNCDVSKMLIFGMGRMRCPGEVFARRMVGSVLGSLVQCFDWTTVGEEMIDMTEDVAITMGKEIPLEAMYRPRENMMSVLPKLGQS